MDAFWALRNQRRGPVFSPWTMLARTRWLGICATAGLLSCAHASTTPKQLADPEALPAASNGWSGERKALHVLNRLAFGPRPGDIEAVEAAGISRWMEEQLHPDRIPDPAVDAKLRYFETLQLSTAELLRRYPAPDMLAKQQGVTLESQEDREAFRARLDPFTTPRQMGIELVGARMIRAVESRRQLEEVLVDFWFNHFNVSEDKGVVRWMLASYERDALRPHLFGRFRDLLGAVAHHPAMLFYLDNWLSTREGFLPGRPGKGPRFRLAVAVPAATPSGLNENYARELLELHTLGVQGGYTQDDVRETARCFTGWSIEKPRQEGTFIFRPRAHDPGAKHVLGQDLPQGGGEADGERVLDLLARHPSTARFLARKLCQKFVSDEPPPALVERVAQVYLQSDGNLTQVYEAIFRSPEFWSDQAFLSKTKKPLELAASAIRALDGQTAGDVALSSAVTRMGEAVYRAQPPTGYPEVAAPWVNAGALVARINFGLALVMDRIQGASVQLAPELREPQPAERIVDRLTAQILHQPLTPATRTALLTSLGAKGGDDKAASPARPVDARTVAGLLLGSPEFQKQ